MPRSRIFISYSHRDQPTLDGLLPYLDFLPEQERVDVWSDQRLGAAGDWDREIRAAIDGAGIAVLLVSQSFLRSRYVFDHELPPLVAAAERGELALTCLYLDAAQVGEDRYQVPVTDPDGTARKVRLDKYQGLNDPNDTLDAKSEPERKRLYVAAAEALKELARERGLLRRRRRRLLPADHFALAVHLDWRADDTLVRTFSLPDYPRFLTASAAPADWAAARALVERWHEGGADAVAPGDLGATLVELLLGPERADVAGRVLAEAFQQRDGLLPAPDRYPLRVLLQLSDPRLAALPWLAASREGRALREAGWTFELRPPGERPGWPEPADVQLLTPCGVLFVAPDAPVGLASATPHCQDLDGLLQQAWRDYARHPQRVRTRAELVAALGDQAPEIVYFFGRGRRSADGLRLVLQTPEGGEDALPVAELAELWRDRPPRLVLCQLAGVPGRVAAAAGAALVPAVRAVAVQATAGEDTSAARSAALAFLRALLSGEANDPADALAAHGAAGAAAWTDLGRWSLRTPAQPLGDDVTRLLVDRRKQRALVAEAVVRLVQDRDLRVYAALAHGTPGNGVDDFAAQVRAHLHRHHRRQVRTVRLGLDLPAGGELTQTALAAELRRQLGLAPRADVGQHLRERARAKGGIGDATPVVLLDWRVLRGLDAGAAAARARAWLELACHELARRSPPELRVFSLLVVELRDGDPAPFRTAVLEAARHEALEDYAFHFDLLEPLDRVPSDELREFLRDRRHCNAPDGLRRELPRLIHAATGGAFEPTVELLERGARGEWYDLRDELLAARAGADPRRE